MKPFFLICLSMILVGSTVFAQFQLPTRGLCAHRGAMDIYPENTIPSFQEAIAVGAQMIELDVNVTKDGIPVIMHDGRVDRTTNDTGFIQTYSLAELKKLDAGSYKGERFKGVKVPTLEETLAIMPRNIWLNCHIKGGAEAAVKTAEMLKATGRLNQAFLSCNIQEAAAAKKISDLVMICNMEGQRGGWTYVENTISHEADFLQFWPKSPDSLTMEMTEKVKNAGIMINYFQPQDYRPQDIRRLFSLGVQFILVGDPQRFMPYAEEFGAQPVKPIF